MYYHYFISYCVCINGYIIFKDTEATSESIINSYEDIIDLKKVIANNFQNVDFETVTIINYKLIRNEKY